MTDQTKMGVKLFIVHWKESEVGAYANPLRDRGYLVETESQDGARAGRRIKEIMPDVIIISLSRLPSHGRETAFALRSMKATRSIPLIFIGGNADAIEKTRLMIPDAIYTSPENLESVLKGFA